MVERGPWIGTVINLSKTVSCLENFSMPQITIGQIHNRFLVINDSIALAHSKNSSFQAYKRGWLLKQQIEITLGDFGYTFYVIFAKQKHLLSDLTQDRVTLVFFRNNNNSVFVSINLNINYIHKVLCRYVTSVNQYSRPYSVRTGRM